MAERGYQTSTIASWASLMDEAQETNPHLVWPLYLDVFDKMRREDAQVASVMRAVTQPIRSAVWVVDPAGADERVVQLVAGDLNLPIKGRPFVAPLRTRGRFSWVEHLRHALLELVYGHSFFEQSYEYTEADDLQHLVKLAWRPPRTIAEIKVARDGGLVGVRQHESVRALTVGRLVAYVNEREGGNWLGQSLLRPAYKPWLLKDRELRAQALTIERNGLGVPVYKGAPVPAGLEGEDAKTWLANDQANGLEIAKSFRSGDAAGAAIPHDADLELKGVTGKLPETEKPIRYQDEQIARAVLAHFLNLGTETGSWALGSTFADFFTKSLNAVANHIADVTQQHVIEDLVDLNFGELERAPRIICEPIGSEHPATAEAIGTLVRDGVITPDDVLEAHMRDKHGLPVKDETTARPSGTEVGDGRRIDEAA